MRNLTQPSAPISAYDAVELSGCIKAHGSCGRVSEGTDPTFWSVYLHLKEGGAECVADFDDQIEAEEFATFLETLMKRPPRQG